MSDVYKMSDHNEKYLLKFHKASVNIFVQSRVQIKGPSDWFIASYVQNTFTINSGTFFPSLN